MSSTLKKVLENQNSGNYLS